MPASLRSQGDFYLKRSLTRWWRHCKRHKTSQTPLPATLQRTSARSKAARAASPARGARVRGRVRGQPAERHPSPEGALCASFCNLHMSLKLFQNDKVQGTRKHLKRRVSPPSLTALLARGGHGALSHEPSSLRPSGRGWGASQNARAPTGRLLGISVRRVGRGAPGSPRARSHAGAPAGTARRACSLCGARSDFPAVSPSRTVSPGLTQWRPLSPGSTKLPLPGEPGGGTAAEGAAPAVTGPILPSTRPLWGPRALNSSVPVPWPEGSVNKPRAEVRGAQAQTAVCGVGWGGGGPSKQILQEVGPSLSPGAVSRSRTPTQQRY